MLLLFIANMLLPVSSVQAQKEDIDLKDLSDKKVDAAPFLFTDAPEELFPKQKESTPSEPPAEIPELFGSFITPDGNLDVDRIAFVGILIGSALAALLCITGIFALIAVFREQRKMNRKLILAKAWNLFQKNRRFLVLYSLVQFLVNGGFLILFSKTLEYSSIASLGATVVAYLFISISVVVLFGLIFSLIDNQGVYLQFSTQQFFLILANVFLATVIFFGLIALPLILALLLYSFTKVLIIFYAQWLPFGYSFLTYVLIWGIGLFFTMVLAIRLSMIFFYVIDKKMNSFGALVSSWKITRGKSGELFLLYYLLLLINIAGAMMLFGFGLFFSIPLSFVILAATFRELLAQAP